MAGARPGNVGIALVGLVLHSLTGKVDTGALLLGLVLRTWGWSSGSVEVNRQRSSCQNCLPGARPGSVEMVLAGLLPMLFF